tara:strand:+ start:11220 stop:11357 length:138 start_codon:yes stop_codon:yes gene_type:complete
MGFGLPKLDAIMRAEKHFAEDLNLFAEGSIGMGGWEAKAGLEWNW